jgi:hypothetical protein
MAHRLYRRAAMTAVSLTVLVMAGAAQAQTVQSRDCRYEPNYPMAAPYWVDQNGCMRMRSGNRDVFVTGTVAPQAGVAGRAAAPGTVSQARVGRIPDCRYDPNQRLAAPYWIDQNGCLRMRQGGEDAFVTGSVGLAPTGAPVGRVGNGIAQPPAGGVSPVVDGPRGPRGPAGANPPGVNPPAGNPPAGNLPVVDDDDDRPGNGRGKDRSARNNNGLGNGWDPGDVGYVAGDPATDLAKGSDPSNPAHGSGDGPGKGGKGNGKK